MKEKKSKESVGCLPFKANMSFEPPLKRSRRRYLMKQRMKEWEGAKLLTMVRIGMFNLTQTLQGNKYFKESNLRIQNLQQYTMKYSTF